MLSREPKVSVVIATYRQDYLDFLIEALDSLDKQTYPNVEVLVVVDNNPDLYRLSLKKLPPVFPELRLKVLLNKGQRGLSASRNVGILNSSGDIICFMDDDAVADKHWIEELVKTYEQYSDACGVGGPILPLGKIPWWLPEEFYWLVGVTPKILYGDEITEVRNTFGSNLSYKREVFERVGLFNSTFGISRESLLQAEEVDFCIRCKKILGKKIMYNPRAIVYHRVLPGKAKLTYLIKRAFDQGLSKAMLSSIYGSDVLSVEKKFLRELVKRSLRRLVSLRGFVHSALVTLLSVSVMTGFTYGSLREKIRQL